jgi:hypothetical protein
MTKTVLRILALIGAAALVLWARQALFPSPERIIRKDLIKLASAGSFSEGQGNFAKLSKIDTLNSLLAENAAIRVDAPGMRDLGLEGRDQIVQVVAAAQRQLSWVKAEFLDISVKLNEDGVTATADFVARARTSQGGEEFVQEFKATFRKVEGKWLIESVTSVKTLSRL